MPRTAAEIEAEMEALRVAGEHPRSGKMRALRAELKALSAPPSESVGPEVSVELPPLVPVVASDDVQFVNEALAQLLLKGKGAGKVEQSYSDIRALLSVKHILEDAAGLVPTGRIALPHWNALGRERDSGELFKPGENQAVVDGLAQRAVPAPKIVAKPSRPSITDASGNPIRLPRTRLDEPEGNAEFVTQGPDSAQE